MTCAQMGGPATCSVIISGSTAEEMAKNGGIHVHQNHPEIAKQMDSMTPEDNEKWMADFKPKFDALPEM